MATVLVASSDEAVGWEEGSVVGQLPGQLSLVQIGPLVRELPSHTLLPFSLNPSLARSLERSSNDTSLPSSPSAGSDLTSLPHLGEAQLCHALRTRFERGLIYTGCGPSLLALNPWRPLPLYTPRHLASYAAASRRSSAAGSEEPHVFGVAASAVGAVRDEGTDQTIVLSGESGAGKSESSRLLLRAIIRFTSEGGGGELGVGEGGGGEGEASGLGERLLLAMQVLEPFGSAQTRRNPQ